MAELRRRCTYVETRDCEIVAAHVSPTKSEIELGQRRLRGRCAQARSALSRSPTDSALVREQTCTCGQAGLVLFEDPDQRFGREALELVDEACVHGYDEACEAAALASELCNLEMAPYCGELRAQGRVPKVDQEGAPDVILPVSVRGCFVVDRVASCPPAASSRCPPAPAVGTTVCFDDERISSKSPAAPWDQVRTSWSGWIGAQTFWSHPDATRLEVEADGRGYGRAHLRPAPASVMREAAALPRVEDVCQHAHECRSALRRALRPAGKDDREHAGEDGIMTDESIAAIDQRDSLLRCLEELAASRRRFPQIMECQVKTPRR